MRKKGKMCIAVYQLPTSVTSRFPAYSKIEASKLNLGWDREVWPQNYSLNEARTGKNLTSLVQLWASLVTIRHKWMLIIHLKNSISSPSSRNTQAGVSLNRWKCKSECWPIIHGEVHYRSSETKNRYKTRFRQPISTRASIKVVGVGQSRNGEWAVESRFVAPNNNKTGGIGIWRDSSITAVRRISWGVKGMWNYGEWEEK